MLLAIAGMVGAGKSTLTRALASRFGMQWALERVDDDNPWLPSFYNEPDGRRRYALPLQLHFLATRFASMRAIRRTGGSWVLDRTWYEDADVFARGHFEDGLMTAQEYDLYQRLYAELLQAPAARPPRLLVYLHGPLHVILRRIALRGRTPELTVEREYWATLHARYERWIGGFRHCPVLPVDIRAYDLLADRTAVDAVAALVRARLEPEIPQMDLWPPPRLGRATA